MFGLQNADCLSMQGFCFKERVTYVALLIITCSLTCNQKSKKFSYSWGVHKTNLSEKSFNSLSIIVFPNDYTFNIALYRNSKPLS